MADAWLTGKHPQVGAGMSAQGWLERSCTAPVCLLWRIYGAKKSAMTSVVMLQTIWLDVKYDWHLMHPMGCTWIDHRSFYFKISYIDLKFWTDIRRDNNIDILISSRSTMMMFILAPNKKMNENVIGYTNANDMQMIIHNQKCGYVTLSTLTITVKVCDPNKSNFIH